MIDGLRSQPFHDRVEVLFRALPPRDSKEYLRYLRRTKAEELPAQVLVRAYRECVAQGWEDARRRTFEALIREAQHGRFEHLEDVLWQFKKRLRGREAATEALDLLQDTLIVMLEVLPTKRGEYGEKSWRHFARQCAIEAWRKRYGRRGERAELPRPLSKNLADGGEEDPAAGLRGNLDATDVDAQALISTVVLGIEDPLLRAIAEDQWLSGDPSPASGEKKSASGKPSLKDQFGVSRDRVVRALYDVEELILNELEKHISPERLAPYRKKPR